MRQPLSFPEPLRAPDSSTRVPPRKKKEAPVLLIESDKRHAGNRWLQDPIEQEERRSAGLEESGFDLVCRTARNIKHTNSRKTNSYFFPFLL